MNLLPSRLSPTVPFTMIMPYKKGKSGLAGMCMHTESYGEHPYVPVELFAPFSAAQSASRLRVRASQTSIATWKGTRTSALRIGRRCLERNGLGGGLACAGRRWWRKLAGAVACCGVHLPESTRSA